MSTNFEIYLPDDLRTEETSRVESVRFAYGKYITQTRKSLWHRLTKTEYFSRGKVNREEIVSFTRELATLLESGVPIGESLELLAAQRVDQPLGPVVRQIGQELVGGATLAEAFGNHSEVFDEGYIRSISSASKGAPVARALYRAADFMSERASIVSEMKRQLTYPVLVLAIGFVIVGILLTVSLPQMVTLFTNLDAELPLPTRILISISNVIRNYPEYIFLTGLVLSLGTLRFLKTDRGRRTLHRAMLMLPIVNKITLYNDMSKMSEVTSSLLESGMTINTALNVAKDSVSNDIIRAAIVEVCSGLESGEGLSQPLRQTGLFPATFTQSLEVSENTGTLQETLSRLSRLYREEARTKIKSMISLVQPLSTILVALVVGFIAISVIMPMYTALGQID